MELSPTAIGVILVVILSVTTTQYWIAPPMATEKTDSLDQNEQEESQVHYYHGPANGEFDWCEPNYLSLAYIAEPINTLSGALYFLPVIAGFRFHRMKDLSLSTKLNLIFVAWIGVGTILFHATLRYTAQLLDELPIYYVMISGTYMLLVLGKADGSGTLGWFLTIWASALTMVILLTDQDDWVHNVARGTLSVSFSLMFAHLFAGVATALRKLKKRVEANPRTQAEDSSAAAAIQSGQKLFQQTFFYFVLAILCWIVDNGFCDHLHPEGMYVSLLGSVSSTILFTFTIVAC